MSTRWQPERGAETVQLFVTPADRYAQDYHEAARNILSESDFQFARAAVR